MKIALAQLTASDDKKINLQRAIEYIQLASKQQVDLIVFPEIFMAFLAKQEQPNYAQTAEPLTGNFVTSLCQAAQQYNIHVICGVLQKASEEKNKCFNSIVLIDNNGKLLHKYSKTHLYDAFGMRESNNYLASDNPISCIDSALGRIGLLVCYELRFPEICRTLALQEAQIIIAPTAWVAGPLKEYQLQCLASARAIENNLFVCVANQVGNIYTGKSAIYDPMGNVIAQAGVNEQLLISDIDLTKIEQARKQLPCLKQRQPKLYQL